MDSLCCGRENGIHLDSSIGGAGAVHDGTDDPFGDDRVLTHRNEFEVDAVLTEDGLRVKEYLGPIGDQCPGMISFMAKVGNHLEDFRHHRL